MMPSFAWLGPVLVVVTGIPLVLLPLMGRRTVPLGVSVPSGYVDHPAVRAARLRYHLITGIVTAALAVGSWWMPPMAVAVALLAMVAVCFVIHARCRRSIIAIKAAEGWYDGERVGLAAAASRASSPDAEIASGASWFVAAALILILDLALTVALFPSMPDPIPVHFGADGTPDRWVAKSWWSALQITVIMATTVAFLAILLGIVRRIPLRLTPDGSTDRGRGAATARLRLVTTVLGVAAVLISLIAGVVTLAMAFPTAAGTLTLAAVLVPVVLVILVVALSVRTRRRAEQSAPRDDSPDRIETPDDDAHWLGGLVYVNRRDPALMVPKRYGIGWTMNLGHPIGIAVTLVVVLALIGSIVAAVVLGTASQKGM